MDELKRLISWPIAAAAALIAVLLTTLAAARKLPGGLLLALFVVLLVLIAVTAWLIWRRWKSQHAAEEIEKSIVIQADRAIERSTFGEIDQMKSLKQDLLTAIEALKKSSLVKRSGGEALSALPWYMLIGPAESGKGTLVRRSGLHFVLQDSDRRPRSVKGIGGTRAFEWWLAEEGVLLDMSGRTLKRSEFDDADDWNEFLAVLRQHRKQRAINGVVVAVAVDQLADQPDARIDALASTIRDRIKDLIAQLGIVFPAYVVFTRCDRVAGFAEFFEDASPEERRQIWGATFKFARTRTGRADALFRDEFALMLGVLSERRLRRAAALPDKVQRARAFVFPLQMERVEPALARFVGELFKPAANEDFSPMRGFYVASAYAGNESDDRVLEPAVSALGLQMGAVETPPVGEASWFAQDIFQDVIFPDANLATVSKRKLEEIRQGRQRQRLVAGGAGLGLALLLSLWSCGNLALLGRAKSAARATTTISLSRSPSDLTLDELKRLDDLRAVADALHARHDDRPFAPPLYATAAGVRGPVTRRLADASSQAIYGLAAASLATGLTDGLARPDSRFVDVFLRYRAWRLLTAERATIVPEDSPVLAAEVDTALAASRANVQVSNGSDAADQFRKLLREQVAFLGRHARAYTDFGVESMRANDSLARRSADWLVAHWDDAQLYTGLVADVNRDYPPVDFRHLVGEPGLLTGRDSVPGAFTREAWEGSVRARMQWTQRQVQTDNMLHAAFDAAGRVPPDLFAGLVARYADDYVQHWTTFVNGVTINPAVPLGGAQNFEAAENVIDNANRSDSQIDRLLARLKDETQFGADPAHAPLQRVSHEFDVVSGYFSGAGGGMPGKSPWYARLGRSIGGIFRRSTGQAALNERQRSATYHALLDKIKANLEKSKDDPTQIAKTLGDAGYQFTTNVSQPLREGREGERGLDPVITLLQRPIDHAVGGVTAAPVAGGRPHGGAFAGPLHQQLAAAFEGQLKSFYPFNSGATVDVSAAALQSFFGPGGSFWSALAALKITDLINEDGSPKSAGAAGVDASVVSCVKRAYEIRQALFSAGAPGMKVYVEPEQIDAPKIDWTELTVGGAPPYHYDNGFAEERSFNWPGDKAEAGAVLSTHRCDPPISHDGMWGLFHVVEIANRAHAGADVVRATWTMHAGGTPVHVTWKFRVQGAPRNPFEPGFFSDFRLP